MSKKQEVIINGIDVSECAHHYTNPVNGTIYHGCAIYEQINELGYSQDTLCEQNPDCYFKQLKRLQEKNEELKEKIESYNCNANCYKYKEANKYRQALEKIKNITEKLITELPEYNSCYYKDECGDNCTPKKQSKVEYCCYENVDKILTIINEVLNNETTR